QTASASALGCGQLEAPQSPFPESCASSATGRLGSFQLRFDMFYHPPSEALPRILVSENEERRLTTLATAAMLTQRSRDVACNLLAEMERADVVPDGAMPLNVVRMNSRVEFEIDGANRRQLELVFPR